MRIHWTFWSICNNHVHNVVMSYDSWIHNAYQCKVLLQLPPLGRNLKVEFSDPQFRGLGELVGRELHQSKAHQRLPLPQIQSFIQCSICRRLPRIPLSLPVGWTEGVENGISRNVDPIFLFDFCTHHRPTLHRLATIHNAADRHA